MTPPLTRDEWQKVACRFWLVADELIHHVDEGRIVVAPGASFMDRQIVRSYLAAVRTMLGKAPFAHTPDDDGPDDDTARGAA